MFRNIILRKYSKGFIVFLCLIFLFQAGGVYAQSEATLEGEKWFEKENAKMQEAYEGFLTKLAQSNFSENTKKVVKADWENSQKAWLKYSSPEASVEAEINAEGGSIYSTYYVGNLAELTKERTEILKYMSHAFFYTKKDCIRSWISFCAEQRFREGDAAMRKLYEKLLKKLAQPPSPKDDFAEQTRKIKKTMRKELEKSQQAWLRCRFLDAKLRARMKVLGKERLVMRRWSRAATTEDGFKNAYYSALIGLTQERTNILELMLKWVD